MHKLKIACFASLLATGIAQAAGVPCNGFEVKFKNNTPDDLLINKIEFSGAEIHPNSVIRLHSNSEQVFTVRNSIDGGTMSSMFEFHSISLPSKKVIVSFDLKNKHLICHHSDKGISSDYPVHKTRLPGYVAYKIG